MTSHTVPENYRLRWWICVTSENERKIIEMKNSRKLYLEASGKTRRDIIIQSPMCMSVYELEISLGLVSTPLLREKKFAVRVPARVPPEGVNVNFHNAPVGIAGDCG